MAGTGAPEILVADDEVAIACCVAMLFRRAGHACRTVHDGLSAWRALKEDRPRLVVLDLQLPGLSGFELCSRIRADPELASMHVLVLTGHGLSLRADWRRRVDADRFLLKPVDSRVLVEHVDDVLGQPSADELELPERDVVLPLA
ncbi:MAG: response regulator [Acidobacteriota bacterium]